ncbi:MAG TPA: hypothetical protein VGN51_07720 [Acidimicrobiia bacterium]
MHFSPELREHVLDGTVTLTFRLWTRPQVKVGGRYRVDAGTIEVDEMELVPFGVVNSADIRQCGEPDRETLRARTAHAGPVHDDTLVYRIEFHIVDDS